jgi:hypothetical protein
MADELATLASKIKKIEEKVETLEQHVDTITTGGDTAEALVKKLRFKDGDAALEAFRAQIGRSENEKVELLKTKNLLLQQQQGGAGRLMLPVRQEVVMFPRQMSCCIHQQTL